MESAHTSIVLRHMGCHIVLAARCHETGRVVVLVSTDRNGRTGKIAQHLISAVAFGRADGLRHLCVYHEAMSVIGQHVTYVAKHRAGATILAKQSRLSVRALDSWASLPPRFSPR